MEATKKIRNILGLTLSSPLIIAGPCSAESEEQVIRTAKEISALNKASIFRAGIWKPRTRPGQFEGVGEIGLEWLKKAKKETGLKTEKQTSLLSLDDKIVLLISFTKLSKSDSEFFPSIE